MTHSRTDKFLNLTISEAEALGMDSVSGNCPHCGHVWVALLGVMPGGVTVAEVQQLQCCPLCDRGDVQVELIWPGNVPELH